MSLKWPESLLERSFHLDVESQIQPDDISCGIVCLRMMLGYIGVSVSYDDLLKMIPPHPDIGLYDSHVGTIARALGFSCAIYSYNYQIFCPIWNRLDKKELLEKLEIKKKNQRESSRILATQSYIDFLKSGGDILFYPLSKELILSHLDQNLPLIVALDMTFLYDCVPMMDEYSGEKATHFVVLHGFDSESCSFELSDPWHSNPLPNNNGRYFIDADRLINAVLLGQDKNDSALIVIENKKE